MKTSTLTLPSGLQIVTEAGTIEASICADGTAGIGDIAHYRNILTGHGLRDPAYSWTAAAWLILNRTGKS
jgi:hypothetical protein